MNLANEGLEVKRKEDEATAKKRKAEEDKLWEGLSHLPCSLLAQYSVLPMTENREQRVDSWRSFSSSGKKKKKAKVAVLG
jgi:DnaJ family protein C protein 8